MKTRNIGILLVTTVLGLGTLAHAQAPTPGPGGKMRPGRMGKNRPGRNPGDKMSDKLLREASQRIERAQRQMKNAQPIYDGHRADAISLAEIAQGEIKIGLAVDRLHEQGTVGNGNNAGAKVPDGKRDKSHNDEQVKRSNAQMIAGGKLLEEALGLLSRAQADYSGHRKAAIEATQKAIQQVKDALRSVK